MSAFVFDLAVATAETYFAGTDTSLLKSTDAGASWSDALATLALDETISVTAVAVSPFFEEDQTVFAASSGTILRSLNGGITWHATLLTEPTPSIAALALSADFKSDGTLFAATAEDGVFRSIDRGQSWHAWNFGLYETNVNAIAISPTFRSDQTVWIGTESNLFQSTNGGRAWRSLDFPIEAAPVLAVNVSADRLLIGTAEDGLFRWQDGTWHSVATLSGEPIEQIELIADHCYLVRSGQSLWRVGLNGQAEPIRQVRECSAVAVVDPVHFLADMRRSSF